MNDQEEVDLGVRADALFENVLRQNTQGYREMMSYVNKYVSPDDWQTPVTTINALYDPTNNEIGNSYVYFLSIRNNVLIFVIVLLAAKNKT